MPAHAGDLAAVEDEDEIGVQHGCRALGDEEDGAVDRPQRDPETCVRRVVERRSGVVQNEDLRLFDEGAGDGEALPLPAREVLALLFDGGVQPALGRNDVLRLGEAHGFHQLFVGGVFVAPQKVATDGAFEEHRLLRHDAHALAHLFDGDAAHVAPL